MPAQIRTDGATFFVNVLKDPQFRANGILFGTAAGRPLTMHWAVIDPNRHVFSVWQKDSPGADYIQDAKDQGASLFSDGPFVSYSTDKILAGIGYVAQVGAARWMKLFGGPPNTRFPKRRFGSRDYERFKQDMEIVEADAATRWFKGKPTAHLRSARNNLSFSKNNPTQFYFGKKAGDRFEDYGIAQGDPPLDYVEVCGGFYSAVANYVPTPGRTFNQWGNYGLAPLDLTMRNFEKQDWNRRWKNTPRYPKWMGFPEV